MTEDGSRGSRSGPSGTPGNVDRTARAMVRLLGLLLPGPDAAVVCDDVIEQYVSEVKSGGRLRARLWLAGEVARSIIPAWRLRRGRRRGRQQGTERLRGARFRALGDLWSAAVHDTLRQFRTAPAYALSAVCTLAMAIGINAALFGVVYAVLLRPLPVTEPERVVQLENRARQGTPHPGFSEPAFLELRRAAASLTALAALDFSAVTVDLEGRPERLVALRATPDIFEVTGVRLQYGSPFFEGAGERSAVLSDALWRGMFQADPRVVGSTLRIDGEPYTIAGVLPRDFAFVGPRSDLWVPLDIDAAGFNASSPMNNNRGLIGRLREDAGIAGSEAASSRWVDAVRAVYPDAFGEGDRIGLIPLRDRMVGPARRPLLLLFGAVGFVLLIGCANLASLQLVRGTKRHAELAVRAALGASRVRLAAQLISESVVLALIGGVLGLVPAWLGLDVLRRLSPVEIPGIESARLEPIVVLFALATALAAGVVFSIAPVLVMVRDQVAGSLRGSRGTTSRVTRIAQEALVVAEIALAITLLIGAGLLVRSIGQLTRVEPGFEIQDRIVTSIDLSPAHYASDAAVAALTGPLLDRIRAIPGVSAASVAASLPTAGSNNWGYEVEGGASEVSFANYSLVGEGYFRTLGIPLVQGREFAISDVTGATDAVIVSEAFARLNFPGENPIGRRINVNIAGRVWREIVGVADDVRSEGLTLPPPVMMYFPPRFLPFADPLHLDVVVHAAGPELALLPQIRSLLAELAPGVPLSRATTLEQVVEASDATRRFLLRLLGAFATLAVALAATGIYAVVAYTTSIRMKELGLRLALGARGADVMRLVLGRSLWLAVAGTTIGLAAALGLSRFLTGFLFEVNATDGITYLAAGAGILAVSLGASLIPALRTTRVAPASVLRSD